MNITKTLDGIDYTLHLSNGNNKLGNGIVNLSFPPKTSCRHDAPCRILKPGQKRITCYAAKSYMYPSVKKAWDENFYIYRKYPNLFWDLLQEGLWQIQPDFFRFFVSGDFPDAEMVKEVIDYAKLHPEIKFLAFTKRHGDTMRTGKNWLPQLRVLPDNLNIICSLWEGMKTPFGYAKSYPFAYIKGFKHPELSKKKRNRKKLQCPGNCSVCGSCWSARDLNLDVEFPLH